MPRVTWGFLTLLLAACGPYPRDTAGTLEHIEQSRTLRVGLGSLEPDEAPLARAFLAQVARETGARPVVVVSGSAEHLLAALEANKLDLVIGEFAEDSPWLDSVALVEPLSTKVIGERRIGLAPVAANGENRWVGLLERTVRDLRERGG